MRKNLKWSSFAIYLIPIILVQSGFAKYQPWDQVTTLWDVGLSPFEIVEHTHFYRFLIAYPGLKIEEILPERGFTYYVLMFWILNIFLWRRVCSIISVAGPGKMNTLLFILIHVAMNGRGAIAWSGWLLCVFLNLRVSADPVKSIIQTMLLALALFLSAVTTGVFIVVFAVVLFFFVKQIIDEKVRWRLITLRRSTIILAYAAIFYNFASYFSVSILKNVEFFGSGADSIIRMLSHGAGAALIGITEDQIISFLTLVFLFAFVVISVKISVKSPILIMAGIASFGGMFGFTVLTLLIPIILTITPSMLSLRNASSGSLFIRGSQK